MYMNENTFNDNVKNNNRLPRMRTITKAYAEIKALDPDTDLTQRALRRMVANDEIPTTRIGNKHLINLDLLLDFLSCGYYNKADTCTSSVS